MRKAYPSDISREQYGLISEILEEVKVKTKERDVDLYEVFCAILYRLKNGCIWDALPHDFLNRSTVYYYFRRWNRVHANGYTKIDYVLMTLENYDRVLSVRDINPSMLIGDSKSVQNADTAEEKGYDGAKKNPG
jgi:transposase